MRVEKIIIFFQEQKVHTGHRVLTKVAFRELGYSHALDTNSLCNDNENDSTVFVKIQLYFYLRNVAQLQSHDELVIARDVLSLQVAQQAATTMHELV